MTGTTSGQAQEVQNQNRKVLDWTEDEPSDLESIPEQAATFPPVAQGPELTDHDLLRFAKLLLKWVAWLFIFVCIMRIAGAILGVIVGVPEDATETSSTVAELNSAVKEVWGFTSGALSSIASLILGYYFGSGGKLPRRVQAPKTPPGA